MLRVIPSSSSHPSTSCDDDEASIRRLHDLHYDAETIIQLLFPYHVL